MSSRSPQWSASSITWLETSNVVPRRASWWNCSHRSTRSTGSRPTVGSSSTSRSGMRHQRAGQRDSGALTAGKVAAQRGSVIVEADGRDRFVGGAGVGAVQRREVAHVVDDPQVVVDGRVLRARSRRGGAVRPNRPGGRAPSRCPRR